MSSGQLPPALNFSETEEEICRKWKDEDTFRMQNQLSVDRGDEVRMNQWNETEKSNC
jgi:hypothetical protein